MSVLLRTEPIDLIFLTLQYNKNYITKVGYGMCYNTYMVKITIQADLKCQELKKELFFTIKVFCDVFITIGLIVFLFYR